MTTDILVPVRSAFPVLPWHDSFRIDARHYGKLEEIMQKAIITNFGRPIPISNDGYMPLVQRLFGMIDKKIEDGDYDLEEFGELVKDLETSSNAIKSNLKKLEEIRSQRTEN